MSKILLNTLSVLILTFSYSVKANHDQTETVTDQSHAAAKPLTAEEQALQGKWTTVEVKSTRNVPPITLKFDKDEFFVELKGNSFSAPDKKGTFSASTNSNQKEIDIIFTEAPRSPKEVLQKYILKGIYTLNGDTLTIAWGRSEFLPTNGPSLARRPKSFEDKEIYSIHTSKRKPQ